MVFVMTLAKDDLPELKTFFYEWLAEAEAGRRPSAFELSLQERLIRVEEALSNHMLWSFSTTIAGSGLVIAVLKLWPPV